MARLVGPSEASREVKAIVTSAGVTTGLFKSAVGQTAVYYDDPDPSVTPTLDMLTNLADIRDLDGTPYADSSVTVDRYSMLPLVQFPDGDPLGPDSLLIRVGEGPPWRVYAREDDRFDILGSAVAGAVQRGNHAGTQSADTLTDGSTNRLFSSAEKVKLSGIATGATANSTDAQLRDRSTHTGTQAISTVASLDTALAAKADLVGGVIPTSQIPALTINDTFIAGSESAMLALAAQIGDVAVRTDFTPNRVYLLASDSPGTLADWKEITAAGSVTAVNGQSGAVTLAKADIGLGNVDNISATNLRDRSTHTGTQAISTVASLQSELDLRPRTNWIVVTDAVWGGSPYGSNPKAALAAATAGQTVYFPPGTYAAPAGVGNGYTVVADNVTVIGGPGVNIQVQTWGQPGIDCLNCSGVTIGGGLTVTYVGTRGNHTGSIRGSATYSNGAAVYINGDRCTIDGLRSVNMSTGIYLSSWGGATKFDHLGVNNRVRNFEVSGMNFGILWTGQKGLILDGVYGHDDTDDSSGSNPTHVYYCSGDPLLGSTDLTISKVIGENIDTGQAFQLKYCTNVTLTNHMARNCAGLINLFNCSDVSWDGMGGTGLLANGGLGLITVQAGTTGSKRLVLNNTRLTAAAGVDERLVRLTLDDSEINNMLLVSNRPATPASVDDYELIMGGANTRLRGVTIRARGGRARSILSGASGGTNQNLVVEDFSCEGTRGLIDIGAGSTGAVVKYHPGAQTSIQSGTNYVGTSGGSASYTVSRSEHERTVTLASGSTTATPNPYLETRTFVSVTDASNVTIGAPSGGTPNVGTTLDVVIANNSGGAMGTVTWNAAYVLLNPYNRPGPGKSTLHRFRHSGSNWVEVSAPVAPGLVAAAGDALATGEIVPARDRIASTGIGTTSGTVYLTYFTAGRTETINTLTMYTGSTAAAATPTLCRMGIYSVDSAGGLTLVASTANDTSLFAATNTAYPKALSAPWSKVTGQRYAAAVLVASGSATPSFHGLSLAATNEVNTLMRLSPALSGRLSAQADLPATITAGAMSGYQAMLATRMS